MAPPSRKPSEQVPPGRAEVRPKGHVLRERRDPISLIAGKSGIINGESEARAASAKLLIGRELYENIYPIPNPEGSCVYLSERNPAADAIYLATAELQERKQIDKIASAVG